jgi:hypothetical protein
VVHTRLMKFAALAAALTAPLVIAAFYFFRPSLDCKSPGTRCPGVVPDMDGPLLRSVLAAAVAEFLIVGIAAARLRASRRAALVAVAVVPQAVCPVAAASMPALALVSLACPLVVAGVRRSGGKRAGITVLASLLPSVLFLVALWEGGWNEDLGLPTGFVVLTWMVSVPVAFLAPRLEARVDRF